MPVPVVVNRRDAIRIYALPETITASPRAIVRVHEMQPVSFVAPREELISALPVELRVPSHRVLPCRNVCDLPALSYVPVVAEVFDLSRPGNFGRPSTLRVEVVPESSALRWWAVVSATDNTSNEITLHSPHTKTRR